MPNTPRKNSQQTSHSNINSYRPNNPLLRHNKSLTQREMLTGLKTRLFDNAHDLLSTMLSNGSNYSQISFLPKGISTKGS